MKKVFSLCVIYLVAVSAMAQNQNVDIDIEINGNSSSRSRGGYVDLGLPSGTLWKQQNESGYYTYDEAVNIFGNQLPERHHFVELKNVCRWIWMDDYGYKVVGPNGNSITLPAAGYRGCYGDGDVNFVGTGGYYWPSTPSDSSGAWCLRFYSGGVGMDRGVGRCYGYSVRLVQ